MSFADLGLSDEILRAVSDAGYTDPTPIQEQAIPHVLMGRDILGCAQTGTGKTASFTLPMIDILESGRARARMPRTLILEPTRELAAQVAESFDTYGKYHKLAKALIIGGASMEDQTRLLDRGVDVLIATPGRLIDLFERGGLLLSDVKILVIDEADRMLDMGFIPDVEKIVSLLPKIRQTLFFSATLAPEIRRLGSAFLINPREIAVAPPATLAENVEQGLFMVRLGPGRPARGGGQKEKREVLRRLLVREDPRSALIFCNRKRDVDILQRSLKKHGYNAQALHGDMSQPARTETMDAFKRDEITLLVCSDVAARGLDLSDLSHVFNFDVPARAEDYVHRIGRTARAGRKGHAFTLATGEDRKFIAAIEALIGQSIPRPNLRDDKKDVPREAAPAQPRETPRETPSAEPSPVEPPPAKSKDAEADGGEPAKGRSRGRKKSRSREPAPQESGAGKRDTKPPDGPVVGMGDHVPAFLQRPVKH